jgi:hypothetical protein
MQLVVEDVAVHHWSYCCLETAKRVRSISHETDHCVEVGSEREV